MNDVVLTTALERDVESRFGLVPNFFLSAADAPEVVEKLWDFAKAAYIGSPIPPLFKERLFVYLSRFCSVRYCIVRHCAFLIGYGNPAGDPTARPQTLEQALRLLKTTPPWRNLQSQFFSDLENVAEPLDWPEPESEPEGWIFAAAALALTEPARAGRARSALRHALGGQRFELLMGLITFIRTAHYWTLLHPEITFEEDAQLLLSLNTELSKLLLDDPEAARCELGLQLFNELIDLRDLHERRELEKANRRLELQAEQREMLLKEVNHRVKNSLQIVASILGLQVPLVPEAARAAMLSAVTRVQAIAAVHERLYKGDDVNTVSLDSYLVDLCQEIGRACTSPEEITVETSATLDIPTDMAVPIALIVNELVTNAVKYAGPSCHIRLHAEAGSSFRLTVTDKGTGPRPDARPGLGTKIVDAFASQLDATIDRVVGREGHSITLRIPLT